MKKSKYIVYKPVEPVDKQTIVLRYKHTLEWNVGVIYAQFIPKLIADGK